MEEQLDKNCIFIPNIRDWLVFLAFPLFVLSFILVKFCFLAFCVFCSRYGYGLPRLGLFVMLISSTVNQVTSLARAT